MYVDYRIGQQATAPVFCKELDGTGQSELSKTYLSMSIRPKGNKGEIPFFEDPWMSRYTSHATGHRDGYRPSQWSRVFQHRRYDLHLFRMFNRATYRKRP